MGKTGIGIRALFREIKIHRPQYPLILEWIDREFGVIWKNLDAAADANISCLLESYEAEQEQTPEEGGYEDGDYSADCVLCVLAPLPEG